MSLKKIKQNKSVIMFTSIIIILVFIITVGFSSFGNNLGINGLLAEVRIEKDIRVTGVSLLESTDLVVSKDEDYNVKNIYSTLYLPNKDSSVTYRVEITNLGNVAMGIYDITSNNDNIEISLSGDYKLKDKICNDTKCTLGVKKYIDVTIKYKSNAVVSSDEFNVLLTFDFRPFYTVTYEGFEEDTSSYTGDVIEGDTLKVEFNDFSGKLEVYMDNALLTTDDYTFTNNVLELKNVTGNINIKRTSESEKNPLYTFLADKSQGTDKDFDFQSSSIQNGVFMHEETKDDDYPVYYYRGNVNNSIIYSNFCWKIVRTTETGGLKLLYDGEIKSGTCTDDHNYLGSEQFNDYVNGLASPSQVGYMYGMTAGIHKIAESRYKDMVSQAEIITQGLVSTSGLIIGKSANWDSLTYTLKDTMVNAETDVKKLFDNATNSGYYYTCLSSADTCSEVYYLYKRRSESSGYEVYAVKLTNGLSAEEALNGKTIKKGFLFGNTVSWDELSKTYTLQTIKNIDDLDELEDYIRGGPDYGGTGYHYTCLNDTGKCSEVYYVYYNDYGNYHDTTADGLFGITLHDGKNVTETLDSLLSKSSNTTDSHAKEYIDNWFEGKGSDFKGNPETDALTKHVDELDDVVWCNNRKVAGYHGWDENADNHASDNKYLHFDAFKRLVGETGLPPTRPSLLCDSVNDSFTVKNTKGNQNLKYPIAMLTADEAALAGAVYQKVTDTYLPVRNQKDQFFMTPYYLSDDHSRLFIYAKEGYLDSGYARSGYAIRPAIALKPIFKIASGDGSSQNPYTLEKVQ